MLTRILASSARIIPWTLGNSFLSFFITEGFCALATGLQRYIKAMGAQLYIYIYIYVGPYEIRLNFFQIPFNFFLNSFFSFQFF